MYPETIEKLSQAMDFRTDSLVLIIEDEKVSMRGLLRNNPDFAKKFETVISIPVFTNDELVTFARTYARENGYKMDEMGVLALYTQIGNNQKEGEPMTISQVKIWWIVPSPMQKREPVNSEDACPESIPMRTTA